MGHDHHHDHGTHDDADIFSAEHWDGRYAQGHVWSGNPNRQLVDHAADLAPGDALDVGCGEGADAIWLAERGWRVTAVDISQVALERAAGHAGPSGERITWEQRDLRTWAPAPGSYDLVSAHFVHFPRERADALHRALAAAVRPGGSLLLVGHHPSDVESGVGRGSHPELLFTAEALATAVDPQEWDVLVCDALPRDERGFRVHDAVLHARRR